VTVGESLICSLALLAHSPKRAGNDEFASLIARTKRRFMTVQERQINKSLRARDNAPGNP